MPGDRGDRTPRDTNEDEFWLFQFILFIIVVGRLEGKFNNSLSFMLNDRLSSPLKLLKRRRRLHYISSASRSYDLEKENKFLLQQVFATSEANRQVFNF